MPLKPISGQRVVDEHDDIAFEMAAPDGSTVRCRADRDYVIAIAPDDRQRSVGDIFDEMRGRIELEASEAYDLHGTDRHGEVQLAPIIA
ncbi:MAG: hypothetical protein IT534_13020 [Bauldia sp.]|nr:hypothetical protein [Bauldia sp.]